MSELSDAQQNALAWIAAVVGFFSLLGSGYIMVCYAAFPRLRTWAMRLVLCMSISDFAASLRSLWLPFDVYQTEDSMDDDAFDSSSDVCVAEAFLTSWAHVASVLWTSAIGFTLYHAVIQARPVALLERRWPVFVGVCFGLPLVSALIPLAEGLYGNVGGSICWISPDAHGWRMGQLYIPVWLAIMYNAFVYWRIYRVLRFAHLGTSFGKSSVAGSLRSYPAMLIVTWLGASVNRVHNIIEPNHPVFWLFVWHRATSSGQGILNGLVFSRSEAVREEVRNWWKGVASTDTSRLELRSSARA